MSAKKNLLDLLFNPAALEASLADDDFCAKLLKEDPKILSFIIGKLSENKGYKNAAQSFAIVLKKFTPTSVDLNELCAKRSALGSKNFISLLKVMVDEKAEKDGAPAMAKMLEAASESFREAYLQITAKDRDLKTNFAQEFVAIFDKYIAAKPIPPQFFFSNSRKTARSISPNAKFNPVAALEGNPWQSSCSPSAKANKKTVILQPSFFKGKSDEEIDKLVNQLNRFLDEGFRLVAFKDGALEKLNRLHVIGSEPPTLHTLVALRRRAILRGSEPPTLHTFAAYSQTEAAKDAENIYAVLSRQSIARDEALVIGAENADILDGVFFNSFNSTSTNHFLKALLYQVENPSPLNDAEYFFYLARNSASLDESQKNRFQEYVSFVLTNSEEGAKDLLQIFGCATLTNNKAVLEMISQQIIQNPNAPNSQNLITKILTNSPAIGSQLTIYFLEAALNQKLYLPLSKIFLGNLVKYNDLETLKFLLDRPKDTPDLNIVLRDAAQRGSADVVKLLLERGADVNAKDSSENTALILAAQRGSADVAKLLLEKVANINEKNIFQITALMYAVLWMNKDVAKLLLERGAEVNEKDHLGDTALMIAAQNGNTDVAALLLERRANINEKDNDRWTALMFAAHNGHADVAALLLERRANIDEKNNNGWTALMLAAQNGHADVAALLLRNRANINEKDNLGNTALTIAAQNGHVDVVKLLLERGANVDEKDNLGNTALTIAAQNGHEDAVETLVGKVTNNLYIGNGKGNVGYLGATTTYKMSKAGEFLNLSRIKPARKVQIKKDVFLEVKDGEFFRSKEAATTDLTSNIALLKANFGADSLAQMRAATDSGYASFQLTTKAGKSVKLLGLNYPFKIKALETKPTSAQITSLTIDEDGFYHVQTNKKCVVKYVLEFDPKTVEIKDDEAVDFIEEYRKSCVKNVELPKKESYPSHEEFLEAVYESKSNQTSCGLRVEVALHMMKKEEIDISKIKICTIDGNHVALETVDADGNAKYLELGGTPAELVYSNAHYSNLNLGLQFYLAAPFRAIASGIYRFGRFLTTPFRASSQEGYQGTSFESAQVGVGEDVSRNPLFQETSTDFPHRVEATTQATITAQTLLAAAKKTAKPLHGQVEFSASLTNNKSPNLYICKDTKSLANQVIIALRAQSKMHRDILDNLETPIFILDNPKLLDLESSKFKINKNGEVVFDKRGFLADFLAQVQVFKKALSEIEVAPTSFNAQDFVPTLIIDWSKFSPQERVALNSLIDENPALNKHGFGGIKIVSLDNSLTQDSSFLSRHKEIYEVEEQVLENFSEAVSQQPSRAAASPPPLSFSCDLEGFDDWKSTLFGEIILQNNQAIWQKSNFVKALEDAKKQRREASFVIANSSNPQGLIEFIARSHVLGYFEYQGFKISLPENFSITANASPFNYSNLNLEQHQQYKNCLLESAPTDCQIVNSQLFDSLLFTKKIEGGIYSQEAGLLEKAKDKTLKLFISANLSQAQFYVLFNEAKKHNVKLELYLAPNVLLPNDLENLPEAELPKSLDIHADKKIKSAIILTRNSRKIIEKILQFEQKNPTTQAQNKDILVINVEDFSYQDLVSSVSYKINEDGSLSNFAEKESAFISALKNGQRIILKGQFSADLLEMLQPLLLQPHAQNLMLIIETTNQQIPPHLKFLKIDAQLEWQEEDVKKPAITETFAADISPSDFIAQRLSLVRGALAKNQMLHLTGISGVGKSTLVHEFCAQNNLKLYSGLNCVADFAKDKSPQEKILFIDESNIEDFHLTFLEELKRGEKRILYQGEILTLSKNHKIVFASNPLEYGGGRSLQKLFNDDQIQELELKPMPESYVMHLLERDIFNECKIAQKGSVEEFQTFCKSEIKKYNDALAGPNPLTIRELQQAALLYLAAKSPDALKYQKLSSASFVSTTQTQEVEEQILAAINLLKLQQQGILPPAGTPGILLEGLPGMGKSVMIEAYLKEYLEEDSLIKISSSTSLEEKIKLIEQAYEQGKAIMIDELDAKIDDGLEKVLNLALSNFHPNEAKQQEVREGKLEIKPGFALFATSNGIEHEGRKLISPAIRHRLKAPIKTKDLSAAATSEDDVFKDVCEVVGSWFAGSSKEDELAENAAAIAAAFLEAQKEDPQYSMRDLKAYCRGFFGDEQQLGMEPTGFARLAQQGHRHEISVA